MQIKSDFITNSSSASFIILKKYLNEAQIYMIKNHIEIAKKLEGFPYLDEWQISEDSKEIRGYTSMDNFDLPGFIETIVMVPRKYIKTDGQNYDEDYY